MPDKTYPVPDEPQAALERAHAALDDRRQEMRRRDPAKTDYTSFIQELDALTQQVAALTMPEEAAAAPEEK
jgi:hypothetical protein